MVELHAAWTDAVLAAVTWVVGGRLLLRADAHGRTVGLGLLLVATAATVGAVRFAGQEQLAVPHAGLSGLAACVGLPCVGAGWASAVYLPDRGEVVRRYVFGVLLVVAAMVWWMPLARTGLGAVGMLAVLVAAAGSARTDRWASAMGALGAGLTMAVGLAIGTDGELMGFPRVGWFHLGLALGHGLLGEGIRTLQAVPGEDVARRSP